MLEKKFRLQKRKDFESVFKKGAYSPTPLWTLKWFSNGLGYPRFGFVVSNKISKSAVKRNTIKRRLRDIIRKYHKEVPYPIDIVVITKPLISTSSYEEMEMMYVQQLKKVAPLMRKNI